MTASGPVSAHDVATELRRRLPGLGVVKLHKLLYYVQGHHLAHTGEPLFRESISAWDMGPVVASLWAAENQGAPPPPSRPLDETALNTIGYVVARYGALTATDLINLTHGETPWQTADAVRAPRQSVTIRTDWIRAYFRTDGAPDGDEDIPPDSDTVRVWLAETMQEPSRPGIPDSPDRLRARMTAGA